MNQNQVLPVLQQQKRNIQGVWLKILKIELFDLAKPCMWQAPSRLTPTLEPCSSTACYQSEIIISSLMVVTTS